MIEIDPCISTIVYQESDDELRALRPRIRPGRTALRHIDQLESHPS